MLRKIRSGVVTLFLLTLFAACTDHNGAVDPEVAPEVAPEVDSVELISVSFSEWEAERKAYAPNLLVVDLWATWCTPCLERFPHMVEMYHEYKDRGVQFVSLSLDDREDLSSVDFARVFLNEQNAVFPNFLLDENIMDGFELLGIQTVPAVNIYDRSGLLVRELNNNNPNDQFSDQDIEQVVLELLGDVKNASIN